MTRLFSKRLAVIAFIAILLLALVLVLRLRRGSNVPGIGFPIQLQDGSVRVISVERSDFLETPDGKRAHPAAGDQFVLVLVDVEGTVPLAGADAGFQNLLNGEWQLTDASGASYPAGGLTEGKLIFQTNKDATGLVLELGNDIKIPLDPILKETKIKPPTPTPAPERSSEQKALLKSVRGKGKIIFSSTRGGPDYLYVINPDGSDLRSLGEENIVGLSPDCSPDGKRIVARTIAETIYIVDVDGSNRVDLPTPADSISPRWSPDGKQIVFVSGGAMRNEIYLMNADGSEQLQLTSNGKDNIMPIWTPDGQIAFFSQGEQKYYLMNGDGSAVHGITQDVYEEYAREWSPDKKAYVTAQPNPYDITVFSADGSASVRLMEDQDGDFGPTWCP